MSETEKSDASALGAVVCTAAAGTAAIGAAEVGATAGGAMAGEKIEGAESCRRPGRELVTFVGRVDFPAIWIVWGVRGSDLSCSLMTEGPADGIAGVEDPQAALGFGSTAVGALISGVAGRVTMGAVAGPGGDAATVAWATERLCWEEPA